MAKLSTEHAKYVIRVGQHVRLTRRKLGISRAALAERLGMDLKNYAKIERGKMNVTIETLLRIADGLGIELIVKFAAPAKMRS